MRPTTGSIRQATVRAAVVLMIAPPLAAQQTLRPGRSVIATLTDGRVVTGRVIAGDSLRVIIDDGRSPSVVDRTSIARVSGRSHDARPVKIFGVTGAVAGAAFMSLIVVAGCDLPRGCGNAWMLGAAAGGAAGGLALGALGSTIGALMPRWNELSSRAIVPSATRPSIGPVACSRNNQGTAEAGVINSGGYSARVMGTFFCEPELRSGIEVGYLARPFSEHSSNYPIGLVPVVQGRGFRSLYAGLANEWSIGMLPLDPHIITSIEAHVGSEQRSSAQRGYQSTVYRSYVTDQRRGLGFGLGASLGYNASRSVSIRTEERTHLTPLGVINVFSLSAQWRP